MMKGIRSRTGAEVVKGLPRGVDGPRDEDDVLWSGGGDRRIHRIPYGRHGDALRIRSEGEDDLVAAEGAGGLRPARVHVGGEGAEGGRHAGEILVVEDADDKRDLPSCKQFLNGNGQCLRRGAIVRSIYEDRRGLPNALESSGPPGRGHSVTD